MWKDSSHARNAASLAAEMCRRRGVQEEVCPGVIGCGVVRAPRPRPTRGPGVVWEYQGPAAGVCSSGIRRPCVRGKRGLLLWLQEKEGQPC